jgi:hypothetical protein
LATPFGNGATSSYYRHGSSAFVAILIGVFAGHSPWLLLPLILLYAITVPADSGSLTAGMAMSADPEKRRRDNGGAFDGRLRLLGLESVVGRRRA